MALVADFISSTRTGDNVHSVVMYDNSSGGTVTYCKWIMGDGTVYSGYSIVHLYQYPGKYTVTYIVGNSLEQSSVTKKDFIIVNEVPPIPKMEIMQSCDSINNKYWKVYIKSDFRMVFEDQDFIFTSESPVIIPKKWTLLEYHAPTNKFYVGSCTSPRREVTFSKRVNISPVIPSETKSLIADQSTIKIDELKIWATEKNLKDYYYELRGMAGRLDLTT